MPSGRPTKWSQKSEDQAFEYINNFQSYGDEIPSHVGICKALGIGRSTLYRWAESKPAFKDILELCNELQERELMNKGLNGQFNPNIVKLALGKHGYHDKQDTTHSGPNGGPVEVKSIELVSPVINNGEE